MAPTEHLQGHHHDPVNCFLRCYTLSLLECECDLYSYVTLDAVWYLWGLGIVLDTGGSDKDSGSTLPLFPGGQDICVDRGFCCSLSLVYNS